jgi:hypothetical protein
MILRLNYHHKKGLLFFSFFVLLSFLYVPSCGATVNKSTVSVVVSTKDQDNWYDLKDKTLSQTYAICDGVATTDATKYAFTTGCDNNGVHDDALYTDTKDERNVYPVDKEFTIKASASASSGSITNIKLEWIYGLTGTPKESRWTEAAYHPGSDSCKGKGVCTFCVQGGSCDKPVIPPAALSVKEDGEKNGFHFRVTFSSSSGDSITSGWDKDLSKFHSFIICGPKCSSCENYKPTVALASVDSPDDWCVGLNDKDNYYVVHWKNSDMPSGAVQTGYKLSVRKLGTTAIKTKEENTSNTYAQVPSSWLEYGAKYEWQVEVKYAGQGCVWTATSPWSGWNLYLNVSERYLFPVMTVTNQAGADCLSGGCKEGDTLYFNGKAGNSSGSVYMLCQSTYAYSGPDGTYTSSSSSSVRFVWAIGEDEYTGDSIVKYMDYSSNYSSTSSETGNVADRYRYDTRLSITDCYGHTCSIEIPIDLNPDKETKCDDGPGKVTVKIVKPASLCNGLNDTDGFYTVSWSTEDLPDGASQKGYEITLKDKSGAKADQKILPAAGAEGAMMVKIPRSMIDYGEEYEVIVKPRIESADKLCVWEPESDKVALKISAKYPEPAFTVKDGTTDCLSAAGAVCETGRNLAFSAKDSKVYTGSATYAWTIGSDRYDTESFEKSYPTTETRKINLKVTDGAGNFCTIAKDLALKNPKCNANLEITLKKAEIVGDLCKYDPQAWVEWSIPAGYKQKGYTLIVHKVGDPSYEYIYTSDSNSTAFTIPSEKLDWNSEYTWQVKATLLSSNDGCMYNDVSSSVSSGIYNIKTPYKYPEPEIKATNQEGGDCFKGECLEGDMVKFNGEESEVYGTKNNTKYLWNLDGTEHTGVEFSQALVGAKHDISLEVTDDYGRSCTLPMSLDIAKISATNSPAGWIEIAPR